MAQIVQLRSGEGVPDEQRWLLIEASSDGLFYGTGAGELPTGEPVFYVSLAENDVSLDAALAAAKQWAAERNVPTIYVQTEPSRG